MILYGRRNVSSHSFLPSEDAPSRVRGLGVERLPLQINSPTREFPLRRVFYRDAIYRYIARFLLKGAAGDRDSETVARLFLMILEMCLFLSLSNYMFVKFSISIWIWETSLEICAIVRTGFTIYLNHLTHFFVRKVREARIIKFFYKIGYTYRDTIFFLWMFRRGCRSTSWFYEIPEQPQ